MFIRLLLLFTLIPLVEIYVLLQVGSLLGVLPTIALIFITGVAGAYLARSQGFMVLNRIRNDLDQGRLPADQLLDGAMILAGGILLLTPGFCTDVLGFSLLVPLPRSWIKRRLQALLRRLVDSGHIVIRR